MNVTSETNDPTTEAVTTFTRRTFMKTSALTIGAVAVLSQGRALADTSTNNSSSFVYIWALKCSKDPGGNHDPGQDDDFGHNNGTGTRTWWQRSKSTWDGGDDAIALEVRATGPVAAPTIIKTSFTVTGGIKAFVSNDANDGDNLWAGRFYTGDGSDDNIEDDEMAYDGKALPSGVLSINEQTGEVFFEDNPVIITPIQCGCKSSWTTWQGFWDEDGPYGSFEGWWSEYMLVGAGAIGPQIQLSGAAGLVPVNDVTYEFSLGGTLGGGDSAPGSITAGSKVTWKALPQATSGTLGWSFRRMRKQIQPAEGDWVDMGPATASDMQPTPPVPQR